MTTALLTPPQILHECAARPPVAACAEMDNGAPCRLCGGAATGHASRTAA